jgi:phage baseplate assembly protein V
MKFLKRMIQALMTRSVQSAVDDTPARQTLQIKTFAGEVFNEVERWQQYGHTSVPPAGSEQLVVAIGGNRANLAIVCAEDKSVRLNNLQSGDSALYHLEGHFLKLTANGVIEGIAETLHIQVKQVTIEATDKVIVTTPETQISGNVTIGGNVTIDGNLATAGTVAGEQGGTFAGVSAQGHTHDYQDDDQQKTTEKPNV